MTNEEDFSMKWFGVPDAQVVALWKRLRPISKEAHEKWKEWQRHIARTYKEAAEGNPKAIRTVEEWDAPFS